MSGKKVVATNRKARHFYNITDTYEAGIVLEGLEVKSLREGQADLQDSFARPEPVVVQGSAKRWEIFLYNMHIAPYSFARAAGYESRRKRKLLLHRNEIRRLVGKVLEKNFMLIPLEVYFKKGKAKICLGVGKGKKLYYHREELRQRAIKVEVKREISNNF